MRRLLEVHAAQRAFFAVERHIARNHVGIQAEALELVLSPGLGEETPIVGYALRRDHDHAFDVRDSEDHQQFRSHVSIRLVSKALSSYAAYLFDMDGTLTEHDRAIPGAAETLRLLKARGKHTLAVTNNSSLGQHALAERFRRLGLPLEDDEVFSALVATARLVAHERPGARVHVFGNPGLLSEI